MGVEASGLTHGDLAAYCGSTLWVKVISRRADCSSGPKKEGAFQIGVGCP